MNIYFIAIILLILGGFFSLLIKNQSLKLKTVSAFSVVSAVLSTYSAINVFINGKIQAVYNLGLIFQNVRFALDNLSAFFVLVISIMGSLSIIYSNGYLKNYIKKGHNLSTHCVFLPMLLASMLLVVSIQNALSFLIAWEVMSLSSFFLVIFENDKKEVLKAGIKYLVFMHESVIFIILFFTIMSINSGSLDFAYFKSALENNQMLSNIAFMLAFIGFGFKVGFVPFHNWLPDAHPSAPSHVSAIMSGVMIKTGFYGILRVLTFIGTPSAFIGYFVLLISTISALYGVLYATSQQDIKKLLAYCSIENIGIIGMGIGVGMLGLTYNNLVVATLGFMGGILHILNHSIFKELLFLGAGAVYAKVHTRNIELLGGLIKPMPKTGILFLIASIAVCGLPPFNGFVSEFLIYIAMVKGVVINNVYMFIAMIFAISGLALVGTMAILCFTKSFSIVFLGEARCDDIQKPKEDVTISFIFPMVVLALFTILIGLGAKPVCIFMLKVIEPFVSGVEFNQYINLMQTVTIVLGAMVFMIVTFYALKKLLYNKYSKNATWGCGYNKPTPRMQYSGASYASPFITMLMPLFKRVVDTKKPKGVFVKEAHYETHLEDIEEEYFLKPVVKSIEKFFAQFERLQNGNIQKYITYGLIFLVFALLGVLLLG